jgi:hypothetical protein
VRRILAVLIVLAAVPLLALVSRPGEPRSDLHPAPVLDPDLGVPVGAPLQAAATSTSPTLDGVVDAAWESAQPLVVNLHYGLHGREPAGTVELRSLYDDATVYFLARWPSATPGGELDVWRNLFTVHWRLMEPASGQKPTMAGPALACTVGCHTATVDGQGGLIGIRSETIPPGPGGNLQAGGGWAQGMWTLEWSRPRIGDNPYDQDLSDLGRPYRFFVKLFLDQEGQADPVSDVHALRLGW